MGKNLVFLIVFVMFFSSCNSQNKMIDKTVVKNFDIDRYLGEWYELARYDHSFERGLVGITANYSFRDDGKIKVVNTGYKGSLDGEKSEVIGKAKIPNSVQPAKLKVSFFLFFYGDYYVLELDDNYQWALVGSKSNKFLWILSRKPQIDDGLYKQLLGMLSARGYDVNKLIKIEQPR